MRARVPVRGVPERSPRRAHREDRPHRGRGGPRLSLTLDARERAMLSGDAGPGTAFAMRLVVRAAEVLGADRLIPISRAHVDACLYHGEATLDFAARLAEGGTRVAGRAPDAGLHRTDARRGRLVLRLGPDVLPALQHEDSFYPVLGIVLGRRAGTTVAVLDGLPAALSEDRLKALGAAAASSGSVALFHAVGSTPEASSLEAALGAGPPEATETIT